MNEQGVDKSNQAFDGRTGEIVSRQASTGSWIGAVVVVLAIVVAGAYLARKAMHADTPPTVAPAASASAAASAASAPIQHPIEQAQIAPATASTSALPALDDSDASVVAALAALAGGNDLSSLLVRQQVIARIVATVDALPRHDGLAMFTLPARVPKGAFIVDEATGSVMLGERNYARYAPYMQIVDAVDPQALVAWYVHAYPLFQQAYRQLGYPKGYFNDRLIVVIDDLLAAPQPTQPPTLVRSKAFYVYTDPALESRSTGQKLLLRVGPANAAKIKAKLRAIRTQLTGQNLHPAPADTAG
ncbi:hypothetical protein GCM10009121_20020 [Rhodanobacter soli]